MFRLANLKDSSNLMIDATGVSPKSKFSRTDLIVPTILTPSTLRKHNLQIATGNRFEFENLELSIDNLLEDEPYVFGKKENLASFNYGFELLPSPSQRMASFSVLGFDLEQRDSMPNKLEPPRSRFQSPRNRLESPRNLIESCRGFQTTVQPKRVRQRKKKTASRPLLISSDKIAVFPTSTKCLCKNSQCLKLYCECFSSLGYCGPGCCCENCHNRESDSKLRDFFVRETLEKNPLAFSSKYKLMDEKRTPEAIHSRGCKCSKTRCLKNYCECFNAGITCSELCGCVGCQNDKMELKKEQVDKYRVKVLRKRKKTKFLCDQYDLIEELRQTKRVKVGNVTKKDSCRF